MVDNRTNVDTAWYLTKTHNNTTPKSSTRYAEYSAWFATATTLCQTALHTAPQNIFTLRSSLSHTHTHTAH